MSVPQKRQNLRSSIQHDILPELSRHWLYFSRQAIADAINLKGTISRQQTINSYLYQNIKAGIIFEAGRGWYSTLAKPYPLDTKPVQGLIRKLDDTYPLLETNCWSTEQLKSHAHHLLNTFCTFVYIDRELMSSIYQKLKDLGYDAYLNPSKQELTQFILRNNTVIVRPELSNQPDNGKTACIEKILPDFLIEGTKLNLFDPSEMQTIARGVASSGRINIGTINRYLRKRERRLEDLLGADNNIALDRKDNSQ